MRKYKSIKQYYLKGNHTLLHLINILGIFILFYLNIMKKCDHLIK